MTQAVQSTRWLISSWDDLAWLIGSSLLSFVVLGAYFALTGAGIEPQQAAFGLSIVWTISLDGTHLFATYSRTLLDRQWVRERRDFLIASCAVFVLGPLFILGAWLALGEPGLRASSVAFHRFAFTWAYYHLCRQHWGLVVLYRNKHGESSLWGRRFDAWLLGTGLALPYAYAAAYVSHGLSPAESTFIPLEVWPPLAAGLTAAAVCALVVSWLGARAGAVETSRCARWIGVCAAGIAACIALTHQVGLSVLELVAQTLSLAFVLAAGASAIHAVRSRHPLNLPKWGLIGVVLVAHNAILSLTQLPTLVPLVALTLFHNVQYHRIVRFHNVHRYAGETEVDVGWAKRVTDSLGLFCGLSVGFALLYLVIRGASGQLVSLEVASYVLSALGWGIAFHHYVIDAVIWRPSRSPRLNIDLRIRS
jgi:hypothetical protein